MDQGFLEFYGKNIGNVSDIDIWYDFNTGFYSTPPSEGFFVTGDLQKPIVYNRVESNPETIASGINYSSFYSTDGSGSFLKNNPSDSYLRIQDTSSLTGNTNWTFLMTIEKEGSNEGVIFTNLSGNKGFTLGFNASHDLYFEHPSGVFISRINYASYNGIFLSKNGSNFNLGRYNFAENIFEVERFGAAGITFNSDWYIGGSPNNEIAEGDFSGVIDNFLFFNRKINSTTLGRAFSGLLIDKNPSLGVLTITGSSNIETGYVESGIRYTFSETKNLSGDFTILQDFQNIETGVNLIGSITDFCGDTDNFYQYEDKFGIRIGDSFLEYSGDFTESNSQTGLTTGSSVVIRTALTGFGDQITLTTGEIFDTVFEYNCLNECGGIEPIFSYKSQTGIITGFNFIPLSGIVSGSESIEPIENIDYNLFVTEVQSTDCENRFNEQYINQFGYDRLFNLRKFDSSEIILYKENLISESFLDLNNTAGYNGAKKSYTIPSINEDLLIFLNGEIAISGEDYGFKGNSREITGAKINSTGNIIFDDLDYASIVIPTGSNYTVPTGKTALIYQDSFYLGSLEELESTLIPFAIPTLAIEINSKLNTFNGNDPESRFFEKSSVSNMNNQRLRYNEDYIEISKNKNLWTGDFQFYGVEFEGLDQFYNTGV